MVARHLHQLKFGIQLLGQVRHYPAGEFGAAVIRMGEDQPAAVGKSAQGVVILGLQRLAGERLHCFLGTLARLVERVQIRTERAHALPGDMLRHVEPVRAEGVDNHRSDQTEDVDNHEAQEDPDRGRL